MKTFKALDLCCGSGSGSVSIGLKAAGFAVVHGVDINAQPYYPYKFFQRNALECADLIENYDFVWTSPPCQAHTMMLNGKQNNHQCIIQPLRQMLQTCGRPFVIENVPQAPIRTDLMLCGSMFQLQTRRHRLFESTVPLKAYFRCTCQNMRQHRSLDDNGNVFSLVGHNLGTADQWAQAIGETRKLPKASLAQAIPPIYAQHIGEQVIRWLLNPIHQCH
jgi:DNA (cytosine-5)-methyltransferase 1